MVDVTFNGTAKTMTINSGSTLNVIELYSDWKSWTLLSDNAKYEQAFRTFGGDPTATGQFAPAYFFLTNGWRVVINNLSLLVSGNLYTDEGVSPFVNTNSNITHQTSDAATVSTGGAVSGGLTSEQALQLENAEKYSKRVFNLS